MSGSGKCKDNLNFLRALWSCWEKSRKKLGAAEKNKEKVKAICTGFSVLVSQSVEFSFSGKTKIQMLTTFAGVWHCPSTTFLNPLDFTVICLDEIMCNGDNEFKRGCLFNHRL